MYVIMIGAFGGTESCMQVAIYRFYLIDGDVEGQYTIEFVGELHRIYGFFFVEMRNHGTCMNASIGASSPNKFYGMAKQKRHGTLHFRLNRVGVRLNLPAMIGCSVVRKVYEVSLFHHYKGTKYNGYSCCICRLIRNHLRAYRPKA